MLLETELSVTKQTIETTPIQIVDALGVRYFGWMRAKCLGIAPCVAIDSVERVVGRIVVCVDAAADVSTAMISSLSNGEPNDALAERAEHVVRVVVQEADAVERQRGDRDEDVDPEQQERATTAALPGVCVASSVSSFTDTAVSQPQ